MEHSDTRISALATEVRSSDGKLLCRLIADGRTLEIVRRGMRYHVPLGSVGVSSVIFVSALLEEEEVHEGTITE